MSAQAIEASGTHIGPALIEQLGQNVPGDAGRLRELLDGDAPPLTVLFFGNQFLEFVAEHLQNRLRRLQSFCPEN